MQKLTVARAAFAAVVVLINIILLGHSASAQTYGPEGRRERIVMFNGLTRTDVPKWRVHVIDIPSFKSISDKQSALNVTAYPSQLADSDFFQFRDTQKNSAYYKLSGDYQFGSVPAIVANFVTGANFGASNAELKLVQLKGALAIKRGDQMVSAVAFTPKFFQLAAHFFDGGKSVLFCRGCNASGDQPVNDRNLYLIRDTSHPNIENLGAGVIGNESMCGDYLSPLCFCFAEDPTLKKQTDNESPGYVLQVDAGKKAPSRLVQVPDVYFASKFAVIPNSSVLVYQGRLRDDGWQQKPICLLDTTSGRLLSQVIGPSREQTYREFEGLSLGHRTLLFLGDQIIDTANGHQIGHIAKYRRAFTVDQKTGIAYYATSVNEQSLSFTRLMRYNINTGEQQSLQLNTPSSDASGISTGIAGIFILPGQKLLVISGSSGMYLDHAHVFE